MTPDRPTFVDERQVRRGFDRVAPFYQTHATIEREIGRRMLERLDYVRIDPQRVVDLGCGPGMAYHALRECYPSAQVFGIDLAPEMLRAATGAGRQLRWLMPFLRGSGLQKICANAAFLPLRTGIAQLVWSNLMLHWCDDPLAVIREMHRVLDVGGLTCFTTFGPDTLKELRTAFADNRTHTQRFADMHDLGDMLVEAGFADPVMDMEILTLEYSDADRLFDELRRTGAGNAMHDRVRGLTGRRRWTTMRERLAAGRQGGPLRITLELIYGHAWKGEPRTIGDGRAVVNFLPRRA